MEEKRSTKLVQKGHRNHPVTRHLVWWERTNLEPGNLNVRIKFQLSSFYILGPHHLLGFASCHGRNCTKYFPSIKNSAAGATSEVIKNVACIPFDWCNPQRILYICHRAAVSNPEEASVYTYCKLFCTKRQIKETNSTSNLWDSEMHIIHPLIHPIPQTEDRTTHATIPSHLHPLANLA